MNARIFALVGVGVARAQCAKLGAITAVADVGLAWLECRLRRNRRRSR